MGTYKDRLTGRLHAVAFRPPASQIFRWNIGPAIRQFAESSREFGQRRTDLDAMLGGESLGVQAVTVQDRVQDVRLVPIMKPHTHPTEEHTLRHGRLRNRGEPVRLDLAPTHAGWFARPASPSAGWAGAGGAAAPADPWVNSGTAYRIGAYRPARRQPAALASASEQNHRSPGRLIFVRA